MTPKERVAALLIIFSSLGIWRSPEIIRAINSDKELAEAAEKSNVKNIIVENQRGQEVLINNIGDGTVIINGTPVSSEEIKRSMEKKPEKQEHAPIEISDNFIIHTYDFINQEVKLSHASSKPFWASAEWLSKDKRDKLKELASKGIDKQKEHITLSAKLADGIVTKAVLLSIGQGNTPGISSMEEAVITSKKTTPSQPQQLRLFDDK